MTTPPVMVPALDLKISLGNFDKFKGSKLFSDITLQSQDGKNYPAHKIMLAHVSEYFMQAFTTKIGSGADIIKLDFDSKIVEMYLDLIYNNHIKAKTWKDAIELIKLVDNTLTYFRKVEVKDIIFDINLSTLTTKEDINDFFNAIVRDLYHDNVPIEFFAKINNFWGLLVYLNYNDLGEEFTRTVIENVEDVDMKYRIAKKAVADGLDPTLYGLVDKEEIVAEPITPESEPYLGEGNTGMLTDDINDSINKKLPITVMIQRQITGNRYYTEFEVRGKSKYTFAINFETINEGFNEYIKYKGRNMSPDVLSPGTIITITEYRLGYYALIVDDFDIIEH